MKYFFFSISLLLALFGSVQAEGLFRWVDKEGKVHYGDRPEDDAVKAEQKKFSAPPVSDEYLSYETRQAKQNFPVTLYVSANCGDPCTQARTLLSKRAIPYAEKNLVTQEDIDAFKVITGGNSVPALTIGRARLSGFEADRWNYELNTAGYPKTAPYGSRPAKPAVEKPEVPAETEK